MYIDTSVAVKLYVAESDSAACEAAILASGEGLVSSELLYGELYSALLAKERAKEIDAARRELIWGVFESHVLERRVQLLPLNGEVVRDAVELMAAVHPRVPLRTLDAIHLATFALVQAGPLFTKDQRMIAAAERLGLPVLKP